MVALGKRLMALAAIFCATMSYFCNVEGKIFERCELARELLRNGVPRHEIKNWMCIAKFESSYNTAAIGRLNQNGSKDYGIFQMNDRYWCSGRGSGTSNGCRIDCRNLINDDIRDDIRCARHIQKVQGIRAWVAWNQRCNGKDLNEYIRGCGI